MVTPAFCFHWIPCYRADYPSSPLLSSLLRLRAHRGSLLGLGRLVLHLLPLLFPQTELRVREGCRAPVGDPHLSFRTWGGNSTSSSAGRNIFTTTSDYLFKIRRQLERSHLSLTVSLCSKQHSWYEASRHKYQNSDISPFSRLPPGFLHFCLAATCFERPARTDSAKRVWPERQPSYFSSTNFTNEHRWEIRRTKAPLHLFIAGDGLQQLKQLRWRTRKLWLHWCSVTLSWKHLPHITDNTVWKLSAPVPAVRRCQTGKRSLRSRIETVGGVSVPRLPGWMSRSKPSCSATLCFQVFVLLVASSSFLTTVCPPQDDRDNTQRSVWDRCVQPPHTTRWRRSFYCQVSVVRLTWYCSSAPCLSFSRCSSCVMAACRALSLARRSFSSSCFSASVSEMARCCRRWICSSSALFVASSSSNLLHTDSEAGGCILTLL